MLSLGLIFSCPYRDFCTSKLLENYDIMIIANFDNFCFVGWNGSGLSNLFIVIINKIK